MNISNNSLKPAAGDSHSRHSGHSTDRRDNPTPPVDSVFAYGPAASKKSPPKLPDRNVKDGDTPPSPPAHATSRAGSSEQARIWKTYPQLAEKYEESSVPPTLQATQLLDPPTSAGLGEPLPGLAGSSPLGLPDHGDTLSAVEKPLPVIKTTKVEQPSRPDPPGALGTFHPSDSVISSTSPAASDGTATAGDERNQALRERLRKLKHKRSSNSTLPLPDNKMPATTNTAAKPPPKQSLKTAPASAANDGVDMEDAIAKPKGSSQSHNKSKPKEDDSAKEVDMDDRKSPEKGSTKPPANEDKMVKSRPSRKKRRVEEVDPEEDEEEFEQQQQQQRKTTGARREARSDGTPLKKARLGSSPEPIDGKAKLGRATGAVDYRGHDNPAPDSLNPDNPPSSDHGGTKKSPPEVQQQPNVAPAPSTVRDVSAFLNTPAGRALNLDPQTALGLIVSAEAQQQPAAATSTVNFVSDFLNTPTVMAMGVRPQTALGLIVSAEAQQQPGAATSTVNFVSEFLNSPAGMASGLGPQAVLDFIVSAAQRDGQLALASDTSQRVAEAQQLALAGVGGAQQRAYDALAAGENRTNQALDGILSGLQQGATGNHGDRTVTATGLRVLVPLPRNPRLEPLPRPARAPFDRNLLEDGGFRCSSCNTWKHENGGWSKGKLRGAVNGRNGSHCDDCTKREHAEHQAEKTRRKEEQKEENRRRNRPR